MNTLRKIKKGMNNKPKKEPKKYKSFIYFYDGILNEEDVLNQVANQQQVSILAESQTVNAELHSGTEWHSGTE